MAELLFYFLSAAALISALGVVTSKSPMASVLALLGSLVSLGGIYLLAGFQFMAAAQLLVYAGAIMVLFLFVVMLLNMTDIGALDEHSTRSFGMRRMAVATLAAAGLALVGMAASTLTSSSSPLLAKGTDSELVATGYDNLQSIAALLSSRYVLPFQASAVLLLATMIGVLVLAKRRRGQNFDGQTSGQPVLPLQGDGSPSEASQPKQPKAALPDQPASSPQESAEPDLVHSSTKKGAAQSLAATQTQGGQGL